ncbi:hypothetical protein ACGFK1_21340 [Mycobacterium sp. NPDC048908]|uniref:hypothetical protein n=1 Tax=Mycobacterium sp. NPDC048908 TaxID=3364292 RepID=UPI003716A1A3
MERLLRHLVPPSSLLSNLEPWQSSWWPSHALTAGVAEWSCAVSKNPVREWETAVGLPPIIWEERDPEEKQGAP